MKLPRLLRELNWFVVVGVAATACNDACAMAANDLLKLTPLAASLVGYVASVGISYMGNSRLTFRRRILHGPQFAKFATISLVGLAVNQAIIAFATHDLHWPFWEALIPVTLLVPASTFMMSKFWAFRTPVAEAAS